jgi:hypothetical protein
MLSAHQHQALEDLTRFLQTRREKYWGNQESNPYLQSSASTHSTLILSLSYQVALGASSFGSDPSRFSLQFDSILVRGSLGFDLQRASVRRPIARAPQAALQGSLDPVSSQRPETGLS